MEFAFMVTVSTLVSGSWLAAIGSFWGRPRHLDTELTQEQLRRRKAMGERITLLGWTLILLGLVGITIVGLIVGWSWAL